MNTEKEQLFESLTYKALDEGFGVYLTPDEITHFAVASIHFGGDPALEPLVAFLHLRCRNASATVNGYSVRKVSFYWQVMAKSGNPFTEQFSAMEFSHEMSNAIATLENTVWGFDPNATVDPLGDIKHAFEYLCWRGEWQGYWHGGK